MAESPHKSSQTDETAGKGSGPFATLAAVAGAIALSTVGVFLSTGSAFYLGRDQYADVDTGGAKPERVTGQGVHFTNPWKTYNVTKFNTAKVTITLTEPQASVDMDVSFSAPEKLEPMFGNAMGLAEARLQDAFRKNAWTYADTKPVCNVLAQGVEEGLDGYLVKPKVTGCRIKLTPSA